MAVAARRIRHLEARAMSRHAVTIAYAPRGLRREEAARYIGVGASKFDQMVADRQMPKPKKVGGRAGP